MDQRVRCFLCAELVDKGKACYLTEKRGLREQWIQYMAQDDDHEDRLLQQARDSQTRPMLCLSHFPKESIKFSVNGYCERITGLPTPQRDVANLRTAPQNRPFITPSISFRGPSSLNVFSAPSTPTTPLNAMCFTTPQKGRETTQSKFPQAKRRLYTESSQSSSSSYHPPKHDTVITGDRKGHYIVSEDSLLELFRECPKCDDGTHINLKTKGCTLYLTAQCRVCDWERKWRSSTVVHTAEADKREQLHASDLDFVAATTAAGIQETSIRAFCTTMQMPSPSRTSFYANRKEYIWPSVTRQFNAVMLQTKSIIMDRIGKGELLDIAGDAQHDTRGYCADWGTYTLVHISTGLVLASSTVNRREAGGSHAIELVALQRTLRELRQFLPGIPINSLTTDRSRSVIKWMRINEPGIIHRYDPWHFYRNALLTMLKLMKPDYMKNARKWIRQVHNQLYHAVTSSGGDGVLAEEKWRSVLYHDTSFTVYHECAHPPLPVNPFDLKPESSKKEEKAFKKLTEFVLTATTLEDIKKVSPYTQTSCNEAYHGLCMKYKPKDNWYSQNGHDRRTELCTIHWNLSRIEILEGKREDYRNKSYYNKTRKEKVVRRVRKPPSNTWRQKLVELSRETRIMKRRPAPAAIGPSISQPVHLPNSADPNLEEELNEDEWEVDRDEEEEVEALLERLVDESSDIDEEEL